MHLMGDREYVSFFLHTSQWSGKVVNAEPHKCDDLSWFEIDNLPVNTIPYIRRAIAKGNGSTASAGVELTVADVHHIPEVVAHRVTARDHPHPHGLQKSLQSG